MKALSIRQPWAWLVIHGGKIIENRSWRTSFRGRVLIHAAWGMASWEYQDCRMRARELSGEPLPEFSDLLRGGIIGSVEIVDCVSDSESPWFGGPFGFVLRDPLPLPFIPLRGRLGFFDVPAQVLRDAGVGE